LAACKKIFISKEKIKIYQNYAIDSPIVKGIFVANQNSREISVEGKFKIL